MEKPARDQRVRAGVLNILAVVLCALLIPVIVANVTIIVKSLVNPNEPPDFLGYKPFIVLSDSMLPTIHSGDLVIVKKADTARLIEGDVISFMEGSAVITHRIVQITEKDGKRFFATRGDNNNADDPRAVSEEAVQGIYLFGIAKIGDAALFIQTPVGTLTVIVAPLILIIAYYIYSRRRLDKEKQAKTRELEQELEKMRLQLAANAAENEEKTLD
ncbi:MAG: signal peptidase I [Clostridia bacterium]|jgi:signal peptidase|nr:signal peptidase I [Clostridia bacterium]